MSAPLSEQILTQIAEKRDTDVLELPPLYNTIDPEELDAVVQHLDDGHISFTYADCEVTISSEGEITVSDPTLVKQS